MKVTKTELEGILVIEPEVFPDCRGFLYESYQKLKYREHGIDSVFVQDNFSESKKNVVRGLHYQVDPGQAKLVRVPYGEVFDVVVDIRKNSPTFGKWFGIHLSGENHLQMYIPVGFAHGFCVLSEKAGFEYKCSDYYSSGKERGIIWNDPDIGIEWPIKNPIPSEKDQGNPPLKELILEDEKASRGSSPSLILF